MSTSRCYEAMGNLYLKVAESKKLREEFNQLPKEAREFNTSKPVSDQAKADTQNAKELDKKLSALSIEKEALFDEVQQCRASGRL